MSEFEYKMPCGCIVSGQVSHNWVDQITEAEVDWIGYCAQHDGIAEALAASRLALLRRLNANRIFNVNQCPFCLGMPDSTWELGCEPETADRHTDDCELAKELGVEDRDE